MQAFHEFLTGAGFKHAVVSPQLMREQVNTPEFRGLTPDQKMAVMEHCEKAQQVHVYRLAEWKPEFAAKVRASKSATADGVVWDHLTEFEESQKTQSNPIRVIHRSPQESMRPKPGAGEFHWEIILIEPKRGMGEKIATAFKALFSHPDKA